jgi:hypothetical protein
MPVLLLLLLRCLLNEQHYYFIFRLDFITSILFSSFSFFVIAEFLAAARPENGDCLIAE